MTDKNLRDASKKIWTAPMLEDVALDAKDVASTAGTTTPDFTTTAS